MTQEIKVKLMNMLQRSVGIIQMHIAFFCT